MPLLAQLETLAGVGSLAFRSPMQWPVAPGGHRGVAGPACLCATVIAWQEQTWLPCDGLVAGGIGMTGGVGRRAGRARVGHGG